VRKTLCWSLILSLLCAQWAVAAERARQPLVVFAAASLMDVLQKVSDEYQKSSGAEIKLSFAASSALAKQIESGAKADVFVSADQEWMSYLDERKLIDKRTRADLLGNELVLIAPSDSKTAAKVGDASFLKALGDRGKLATGDPDSVPVGKYAKQALTSLRQWDAVQARIARADNVRLALMYVARGEAPLGIVYATDAAVEPKVRVIDTFPASSHSPITYPVATTSVAQPSARAFVDYLRGPVATAAFEKAGFKVLAAAAGGAQ
jgi:molybdate transport system substrate-binding protein